MAKLTKSQRKALQHVLAHATRAHAFLSKDDVVVARLKNMATTTLDYTHANGTALAVIQKEYGSDLTGLAAAIDALAAFLAHN